ncbi:hypothetical protein HW273_02860 [Oribacterium sp. oral taxon 102]|uniref:hypothetical protein n=1 Tax=Oribacterium sp. oral taxon 102 TaxID=671214 RepID=UPI0015B8F500|nr:hypothetical protein [Oribacterium sp. oral taxon 102]NWO20844.1 hypothetical protein [Oribacterium sp. oral taxon 102]
MAQDYGEDVGEMLMQAIGNQTGRALERFIDNKARDWHKERLMESGRSEEEAEIEAEALASREQICLPFGTSNDAAYFAQVCHENGTFASALTDREGNGFIQFAEDDIKAIKECAPQFAEVMSMRQEQSIVERLKNSRPVTAEQLAGLNEITRLPDLSFRHPEETKSREAVRTDRSDGGLNHTEAIREEVLDARDRCTDFNDFEQILARQGIGIITTRKGEVMFYEARRGEDGSLLPFGKDAQGRTDWAVGADTLSRKWDVDATHDWFEKNRPAPGKEVGDRSWRQERESQRTVDGALDNDGATPDLDQGVKSHDSIDTDDHTARIEHEGVGTDISPSMVRDAEDRAARSSDSGYSLSSVTREMREAKTELEAESGTPSHALDISNRMKPGR